MYICIEGIDGSGKSSQTLLLEKWLQKAGFDVLRVFEPSQSVVGNLIRSMLQDSKASDINFQRTLGLLFAADRMILMEKIRKAEIKGSIIITDRSFYSSLVYQDGEEWIREINKHVLKPDIVVLLDIEPETAIKRCEGKDHFENVVFLEKIRKKYMDLAEKEKFYVINANNGINKVQEDIKRVIAPKLGMCI
ncbi:MAG: dTMP kinase [Methanobacteriaceae archaeon]|nr:dTMP kinase [Methanobacteriaceae archaeon]